MTPISHLSFPSLGDLPEERPVLADRLYQGMLAAWKSTQLMPLEKVEFRVAPLRLEARDGGDFTPDAMRRILADPRETRWRRNWRNA